MDPSHQHIDDHAALAAGASYGFYAEPEEHYNLVYPNAPMPAYQQQLTQAAPNPRGYQPLALPHVSRVDLSPLSPHLTLCRPALVLRAPAGLPAARAQPHAHLQSLSKPGVQLFPATRSYGVVQFPPSSESQYVRPPLAPHLRIRHFCRRHLPYP